MLEELVVYLNIKVSQSSNIIGIMNSIIFHIVPDLPQNVQSKLNCMNASPTSDWTLKEEPVCLPLIIFPWTWRHITALCISRDNLLNSFEILKHVARKVQRSKDSDKTRNLFHIRRNVENKIRVTFHFLVRKIRTLTT